MTDIDTSDWPEPGDHNDGLRGILIRLRPHANEDDASMIDDLLNQQVCNIEKTGWRWFTDEIELCVWG